MMDHLAFGMIILAGLLGVFLYIHLKVVNRLAEVNKQLLIVVAGKESKPESALRALVASNKPPQKNLPGIADKKKKDEKPKNTDYKMSIGIG